MGIYHGKHVGDPPADRQQPEQEGVDLDLIEYRVNRPHSEFAADGWVRALVEEVKRLRAAEAQAAGLREALRVLYEETADYIRVNNLGDVHHNRSMQMARAALTEKEERRG